MVITYRKKNYDNNGTLPRKTSSRSSKWDNYYDEIFYLMNIDHVTKKAVYMFLLNKYKDKLPGNYNSFKAYTLRKNILLKCHENPYVLFEVELRKQLHAIGRKV